MGGVRTAPHGFAGTERFLKLRRVRDAPLHAQFPPSVRSGRPELRAQTILGSFLIGPAGTAVLPSRRSNSAAQGDHETGLKEHEEPHEDEAAGGAAEAPCSGW